MTQGRTGNANREKLNVDADRTLKETNDAYFVSRLIGQWGPAAKHRTYKYLNH